jgi:hypothetical protein
MAGEQNKSVDVNTMSLEDRVKWRYEHGKGSIQDIARWDRLTVDEVLSMIGQDELKTVVTQGDLVDESELMPGTPFNNGDLHRVPYTTD